MTTFSELLASLQVADPALPLIFQTKHGKIGAGFHVTELRHSFSKGIDCGGNIQSWQEARLQLLDGYGGEHMRVGKFNTIVEKSLAAVPELRQAELLVEFGHENSELSLLSIQHPNIEDDAVTITLGDARAVCKPAQMAAIADNSSGSCCDRGTVPNPVSSCCAPEGAASESRSCCA